MDDLLLKSHILREGVSLVKELCNDNKVLIDHIVPIFHEKFSNYLDRYIADGLTPDVIKTRMKLAITRFIKEVESKNIIKRSMHQNSIQASFILCREFGNFFEQLESDSYMILPSKIEFLDGGYEYVPEIFLGVRDTQKRKSHNLKLKLKKWDWLIVNGKYIN